MGTPNRFRFLDPSLNTRLIALFRRKGVRHTVNANGEIHYSLSDQEVVENDLICAIRAQVFPAWQVLSCPDSWTAQYEKYMVSHDIPYQKELSDGEVVFLIPRKHRPHLWRIEEPPLPKAAHVAAG